MFSEWPAINTFNRPSSFGDRANLSSLTLMNFIEWHLQNGLTKMQNIDIQQMKLSDLTILHKICCDAYNQNFHDHWDDGGLENYITEVFGIEILRSELSDKKIQY